MRVAFLMTQVLLLAYNWVGGRYFSRQAGGYTTSLPIKAMPDMQIVEVVLLFLGDFRNSRCFDEPSPYNSTIIPQKPALH